MTAAARTSREECQTRLARHSERESRLARRLTRLIRIKRSSIYVAIGYSVFDPAAAMLLIPGAILLAAVIVRIRIAASACYRAYLAAEFYRDALARIEDRWDGRGDPGARFLESDHPFAADLDLFGHGSLFQFLCAARTPTGRETLANWLSHSRDLAEIQSRQGAVREMADRLDVRERLALLEPDDATHRPDAVNAWGNAADPLATPFGRIVGAGLAAALIIAVVLWNRSGQWTWLASVLALEFGLFVYCRRRLRPICANGFYALKTRGILSDARAALRGVSFRSERLSRIQAAIDAGAASRLPVLDSVYATIAEFPPLLLLACQVLPRIDRWRRATAARTHAGLLALGELEALCSLANYAWEQPDATFPELVPSAPCYEAVELGHPLIPARDRVKNDLQLNDSIRLLMVSGSNMSGKSTMLRTVGINAVLALCGGPVCARELRISTFAIGTAMRFRDSLQHSSSHFHAVITRLRSVLQLQEGDRPLLFLLDEILQGTNSQDRVTGAQAVIRTLIDRGGVGLVTTHDLALTEIVEALNSRARNVHFVDQFIDGRPQFDYRMRPGVVQTTNALALMHQMGLI